MKKLLVILAVLMQVMFLSAVCFAEGFDVDEVTISDSGMQLHGYYEFEYWDKQWTNDTFDAHKVVIYMEKSLADGKVLVSAEFEYEHFPRLEAAEVDVTTDDDGNVTDVEAGDRTGGSGEFKVDSAAINIMPVKTTRIYAGIFYVPFGIEFESYPGHKNKLISRPKVMKDSKIIPGTWSDVGVGIAQKISDIGALDVYAVNGDAKTGGVSRDSSGGNENKSVGARLSLTALKGLNIGGSYVVGKYDPASELESSRWGAHLRIDGKDLYGCPMSSVIIAEVVGGTDEEASSVDDATTGEDLDKEVSGYYAQLSFMPIEKVELAVRYDVYNTDEEVDENEKTATTAGISYQLYANTKLKAEYQWNDEEGTEKDDNAGAVGIVVNW